MIHSTNRSLLASLLMLAISTNACSRPSSDPGIHRVAVFEAHDIWDGDNGSTMTRLGLPQQAIYRLDSLARPVRLPMPDACCIAGLTLSPLGDRIAYVTYGADPPVTPEQRAVTGVRVVDGSGSEMGWFPGCYSPRWSRDGTWLAMIEGKYPETIGWLSPVAVRVVDRSGRSRTFSYQPRWMAWGNKDTLFLEYEDRVDALDVARSRSWRTPYVGCEVSPDGQYSFQYRTHEFLRMREDPGGLELGRCLLSKLGSDREQFLLAPFWIRSAARGHLLCLSVSPSHQSPPGQASIRTVVIDARTMEMVHEFPGKLVRPTNDHRSVVLLRGDTLDLVDLPTWAPEPPSPMIGRIRMQIYAWGMSERAGSATSRLVSDSIHAVAVGDWLTSSRAFFGDCGKIIRALRAPDASHVELEIAPTMIGPLEPGAGRIAISREMPPSGTGVTLGRAPVTLRTPSVDGGYDVVLSLVP